MANVPTWWLLRRRQLTRREFVTFAAGAAAVWPLAAGAQPAGVRRVGFLGANTPEAAGHLARAFVERLRVLGWAEGNNLVVEYRWAAGQTAKFRELAAELAAADVDVIVTSGNAPAIAAAQSTKTIPIVLAASADILSTGLVKTLAHPGGNLTGLTFAGEDTVGKRLELLKEILPGLRRVAVLYNPAANPQQVSALRTVAPNFDVALEVFEFRREPDLDRINAHPERSTIGAMFVISDPLVFVHRTSINKFALREGLPTVHMLQEYAEDGGLMSYGPHFLDFFRRSADFVDKILRGANPSDLPIERPMTFRLVINIKTAKALGIAIPEALLARADEVLE